MGYWFTSVWARMLGGLPPWQLHLADGVVTVTTDGREAKASVQDIGTPEKTPDWWWSTLTLPMPDGAVTLRGARRIDAEEICEVLPREQALQQEAARLQQQAEDQLHQVQHWAERLDQHNRRRSWLAYDTLEELDRDRPRVDAVDAAADEFRLRSFTQAQILPAARQTELVRSLDLHKWAASRNEEFLTWESKQSADFFATVEKSPLTPEQIKATICVDNRVRVIASAGSGKTSVMVARAAYAVRRGLVSPSQVLMLAFNKKAADELSKRVTERLGDDGAAITASTFHSLGLRIIGEATGEKPSVPSDLKHQGGLRRLEGLVDQLRDADPGFRRDWDLFRLVFGRPLVDVHEQAQPEAWNPNTKVAGFTTLAGEVVRSQEEVMIANWLFLNGVEYQYERPYEHNTADAQHRQYVPDFYYPRIDAYHEHWALNAQGQPPPHFTRYAEDMQWKLVTHRHYGTTLLETTSASIRDGSGFEHLARELQRLGQPLEENPYRPIPGEQPITDANLLRLFRKFMNHAKSNRIEPIRLRDAASAGDLRPRLFTRLYAQLVQAWDEGLAARREVDFEDMINQAADHLESGTTTSPYRLILVDEMQDTSQARARLLSGLIDRSDSSYLLAVGDDWQSINRFAGSDMSVMSDFVGHFGPAQTVYLTRTFRSPQTILDIAGRFVSKNPAQLNKHVTAADPGDPTPVRAIATRSKDGYDLALDRWLDDLDARLETDATVLVLGRYNNTRGQVANALERHRQHLHVRYSTVHKAKGGEADYVVIVGMERRSFPSAIEDDPLLELVKPSGEVYPDAEERRLFYVALTRTRHEVLLLTRTRHESPFLLELVDAEKISVISAEDGTDVTPQICPQCRTNRLVRKHGKHGPFLGCTGYPTCTYRARDSRAASSSANPRHGRAAPTNSRRRRRQL